MSLVVRAQAIRSRLWLLLLLAPAGCSSDAATCEGGETDGTTGLVGCGAGDVVHRPEATTCAGVEIDPDATHDCGGSACAQSGCGDGQRCTDRCECSTVCETDADCGSDAVCLCGGSGGICIPATCKTDADCGEDQVCASLGNLAAFACTTPNDECLDDSDCTDGGSCEIEGERRYCDDTPMVAGRPFLVEGAARVAVAMPRTDWSCKDLAPVVDHLDAGERERRGDHWLRTAQLEHASVAAFARFALQLLSLGAPPSLVEATHAAMADETRHARSAFALASAYLGRDVGPGPLAIDGALTACSAEEILRLTIREGCFGEMEAALQAEEEAAASDDPIVRDVLTGIALDELRHAELAFSTVAWMVRSRPELVQVVRDEIDATETARPASLEPGLLDAEAIQAVRDTARRQVALPSLQALCEQATQSSRTDAAYLVRSASASALFSSASAAS